MTQLLDSYCIEPFLIVHVVRAHYAKILEAVQKFNQKISNDFKIIEEAQIKMNAPPAL